MCIYTLGTRTPGGDTFHDHLYRHIHYVVLETYVISPKVLHIISYLYLYLYFSWTFKK